MPRPMGKAFKKLRIGDRIQHYTNKTVLRIESCDTPIPDYQSKFTVSDKSGGLRTITAIGVYSIYALCETA